jgi:hypothetical protein
VLVDVSALHVQLQDATAGDSNASEQQHSTGSSSSGSTVSTTAAVAAAAPPVAAPPAAAAAAVTFRTALQVAVARHMAGSMHEAEFIYRQIIGQVSYTLSLLALHLQIAFW